MRLGLMGCGMVADYGHFPAIAATPELKLTAVYDPDPQRAANAAARTGAEPFSDTEDFFRSGLDAVVITSPAPAHHANVLDCARHGLHALCEKPLATSDTEAEEMIEAMAKANRLLITGFDYRFSPVALQIKELVRTKAIGEARIARLIYLWSLHGKWHTEEDGTRVLNRRRAGRMEEGGPMVDCGVHQIDLARWWFGGDITRWHAHGAWADEYEAPDHVWLHLDHASGVHTMVEMSYSYSATTPEPQSQFIYEIIGTDGLIRLDRGLKRFELHNSDGVQQLEWAHEKNFTGMYERFSRALQTGKLGDLPSGEDGLSASQFAQRATEMVMRGRLI